MKDLRLTKPRKKRSASGSKKRGKAAGGLYAIYAEVGANIRHYRVRRGVTQEALARSLGQTRASVANMESGRFAIMLHNLPAIAACVRCRVSDLLPRGPR